MDKYHFIIDKINKNKKLEKIFLKKYKNHPPHLSTIFVVLGGDGFMLHTLKKYQKYNKPFYGINTGTFGFLMNRYNNFDIDNSVSKAKLFSILPLQMKVKTRA